MGELSGRVVVGYDGSSQSARALDWAAQEAARRGASLQVVYAADAPGVLPRGVGVSDWLPETVLHAASTTAQEGLERVRRAVAALDASCATRAGSASSVLVEESLRADLLVVGTRGHGELAAAILGSVAFAVSAHAHCPVVVVRGSPPPHPGPERPLVVGVDGSPAADAALTFAAATAYSAFAPLVIVSVWHPPTPAGWETGFWEAHVPDVDPMAAARRTAEEVAENAERVALADHPRLTVRRQVASGPPDRALADLSRDAGMVVVGARGRGGFTGLLLGSVSHGVIHRASCPVAVVRETR